jgi:UDP-2,4-diacetamido-2,4,6-trideoxy-beta-L-altropyranose hydrolase
MEVVVIRADASADIGGGHIYRCLTLAGALTGTNKEVHFICRQLNGHLAKLIEQRGFDVSLLPADNPIDELNDAIQCRELLEQLSPALIIVDHYQLSAQWHTVISPLTQQLVVIDDIANRPYNCDLLFDQSLARTADEYAPWLTQRCKTVITGAQHALLRAPFIELREQAKIKRSTPRKIENVLVAMGATDPQNVTLTVLQQLTCNDWKINVVLTDKAKHLNSVRDFIAASPLNIDLLVNVSDMAALILESDIAIAAAGTSMLERCCLGLPSVIVCLADNQKHIAKAVAQSHSAIGVIDINLISSKLSDVLHAFINDSSQYQQIASKAFAICNGEGSEHLTSLINTLMQQQQLWLKPVTETDRQVLYQWQLAPKTRQYSRDPNPPTLDQHQRWFTSILHNKLVGFYLIMNGEQQCGYVRLHPAVQNNIIGWEVSIALAPDAYGLGFGHKALLLAANLHPEKTLLAYIEAQNQPSVKTFAKAGYTAIGSDWYQLKRTPHES